MTDDLSWVSEPPRQPPTIIQHWDGLASITLSKISSGARLMWVFDEDFPVQLGVFVHLTDDEAQVVFDTEPMVGLLERVRPTLEDTNAYAWRKDRYDLGARPFEISRDASEEDFAEQLWEAAASPVATIDIDPRTQTAKDRGAKRRKQRRSLPVSEFLGSGIPSFNREMTVAVASARSATLNQLVSA